MVHLGHAHDGAVTDAHACGLRGDRGEHDLGGRAVRVLLEEVVLDRPHPVEAELVGQPRLLERVVEHRGLHVGRERTRRGHLEEDAESHAPPRPAATAGAGPGP
jgi:hypothetical protein